MTERISVEEYRKLRVEKRESKHRAKRDGQYDSEWEGSVHRQLQMLERVGKIRDLAFQPEYDLCVNGIHVTYFTPDFRYVDCESGKTVIDDAKGCPDTVERDWKVRWALMKALYPDFEYRITYQNPESTRSKLRRLGRRPKQQGAHRRRKQKTVR